MAKFIKANLDGEELKLLIESLEARKEIIKTYSIAIDTALIDYLIKYLRRGLTSTPNGQFIVDTDRIT